MTTDMWTDNYRKLSYLTVTVHYADHMFTRIFDRVLCTVHFAETKTGENIHEAVSYKIKLYVFSTFFYIVVSYCFSIYRLKKLCDSLVFNHLKTSFL